MKKICFKILCLLFVINIYSQKPPSVEYNFFKVGILSPGLIYERKISYHSTLVLSLEAYPMPRGSSFEGFFPIFTAEYRKYYNLNKRVSKGKSISNNSGNFTSFASDVLFEPFEISREGISFVAPSSRAVWRVLAFWGSQKTFKSGFNYSYHLGFAYTILEKEYHSTYTGTTSEIKRSDYGFVPSINLSIGWVLFRNRN